ncbi:hypothetical protein CW304_04405 [Bacillus sp. UFRGS-B20]|nr:hypothetical protein CW304_04405 [Bacillus sp. UFRGS-B20]
MFTKTYLLKQWRRPCYSTIEEATRNSALTFHHNLFGKRTYFSASLISPKRCIIFWIHTILKQARVHICLRYLKRS